MKNDMKLIYITGATSCGKSTLANQIAKDATIFSLDAFSKSVRFVFHDFKLYNSNVHIRPVVNNDRFLQLVKKYIDSFFDDYPNRVMIVEGCHFTPEEFINQFPYAKIICLGITKKSRALEQINKRDWMSKLSEDIKRQYVNQLVEYSSELKENASYYKYFDIDEINENSIRNIL